MIHWTPEEDQILRDIIESDIPKHKRPALYAARLPNRTINGIHNRMKKIGLRTPLPTPRPPTRKWTEEELAMLKRDWDTHSIAQLAKKLERTVNAVATCAKRIGLPRKSPWGKVTATPAIDAAIRAAYNSTRRGACKLVSDRHGVPVGWIKSRARHLGLTRSMSRYTAPWTDAEDAIVEQCHERGGAHYVANRLKAAGYNRSTGAVENRLHQLGLSWKNRDIYTASDLARAMGIDTKTVTGWIGRGYLNARKENPSGLHEAEQPHQWLITHRDARRFLIEHTARYRLATCDRYWFVSTLANNPAVSIQNTCGKGDNGGLDEMRCAA